MLGNTEADYLLYVDNKAIAVVEAKREENPLGEDVQQQAEGYATHPLYGGLWFAGLIPLVYLANGKKIYFRNCSPIVHPKFAPFCFCESISGPDP